MHHAAQSAMSRSNSSLPGMFGHGARSEVGLTVLTVTATSHVIHFDLLLESTEGGADD